MIHPHLDVSYLRVLQMGVERYRDQGSDDPRPRPDSVLRYVEPQRRPERVLFVFGREDALRNVPIAARRGSRIPVSPPVHPHADKERDKRHPWRTEAWNKGKNRTGTAMVRRAPGSV